MYEIACVGNGDKPKEDRGRGRAYALSILVFPTALWFTDYFGKVEPVRPSSSPFPPLLDLIKLTLLVTKMISDEFLRFASIRFIRSITFRESDRSRMVDLGIRLSRCRVYFRFYFGSSKSSWVGNSFGVPECCSLVVSSLILPFFARGVMLMRLSEG